MKVKVKTVKVTTGPRGKRNKFKQTRIWVDNWGLDQIFFLPFLEGPDHWSPSKYAYATIDHEEHEAGIFELKFWFRQKSEPDPAPKEASTDGTYEWVGGRYRKFTDLKTAIEEGRRGVFLLNGKKPPKSDEPLTLKDWGCLSVIILIGIALYLFLA